MRTAVDYAQRAAECRRLAGQYTTRVENWAHFSEMAETWEMLHKRQQEKLKQQEELKEQQELKQQEELKQQQEKCACKRSLSQTSFGTLCFFQI